MSQYIGRMCLAMAAVLPVPAGQAAQVARSECFPVERVPEPLRARAEAVLLETLDGTALYTIAGLKPMTSGFLPSLGRGGGIAFDRAAMRADSPVARQIDELRQVFSVLRCGDDIRSVLVTDILSVGEARGVAEPYVFHLPAIRGVITALPDYFGALAITPHASPETVIFTMRRLLDSAPREDREAGLAWRRAHQAEIGDQTRATGLLYGYPRPAVEAFVVGTLQAIRGELPPGQKMDPALSMRIPTFSGDEVWYRKATLEDSPEDRALRARAAHILAEYRTRRAQYVGSGKPGIVALLRDWFCKGDGGCAAANVVAQRQP